MMMPDEGSDNRTREVAALVRSHSWGVFRSIPAGSPDAQDLVSQVLDELERQGTDVDPERVASLGFTLAMDHPGLVVVAIDWLVRSPSDIRMFVASALLSGMWARAQSHPVSAEANQEALRQLLDVRADRRLAPATEYRYLIAIAMAFRGGFAQAPLAERVETSLRAVLTLDSHAPAHAAAFREIARSALRLPSP
jgi:hypothetical protein